MDAFFNRKNRESASDWSIIHYSQIFMLFTNLKLNVITMPLSYYDTCFFPFLLFYSFVLRMSCNICFFLACFFYFFLLLTLSDTYFFLYSLFLSFSSSDKLLYRSLACLLSLTLLFL